MLEERAHLFHHHGTYVALRLLATCLPWKGSNVMKGMMQGHQRAADSMPMPGGMTSPGMSGPGPGGFPGPGGPAGFPRPDSMSVPGGMSSPGFFAPAPGTLAELTQQREGNRAYAPYV